MPTAGQRYKAQDGQEYEYISGDMWNQVSKTHGGRGGGGGKFLSSFQIGYEDPASVPVSNPTATSNPNINSGTGVANPATTAKPDKTEVSREDLGGGRYRIRYSDGTVLIKNPGRQMGATVAPAATPAATTTGRSAAVLDPNAPYMGEKLTNFGGAYTWNGTGWVNDATGVIKNSTQVGWKPSTASTPTSAPGPGGAPAQKEDDPNKGAGGTTGIFTKPTYTKGEYLNDGKSIWDGEKIVNFKEGDTRGQGAEIFKNGQWVANTPPPENPVSTGPLPSTVNPDETLIAPQNDANPVSNANALRRSVEAELPEFTYSAEDIAREAMGLGLDQYIPSKADIESAVDLYGKTADQNYQNADFDLRNRYGGAGIGGGRVLSSARLAQDYSMGKAAGQQNLKNQMLGEGFQRALGKLGMGQSVLSGRAAGREGRYNSALSAALSQNAQQMGITQQERQRAYDAQQRDIDRKHETATAQSAMNQQGRAAILSAILPSLIKASFPEGQTAEDAYYKAMTEKVLKEAGIDPTQYAGDGDGMGWLTDFLGQLDLGKI